MCFPMGVPDCSCSVGPKTPRASINPHGGMIGRLGPQLDSHGTTVYGLSIQELPFAS